MQAGRLVEAIDCYCKVVNINTRDHEAFYNMGIAHWKLGNVQDAVACFRKAIDIKPDFIQAYNNLAAAFSKAGQYEQAEQCYQNILAYQPDNARVLNSLGLLLKTSGKLDQALACFKKAAGIDPDLTEAHCYMADLYRVKGDSSRAVDAYLQALRIDPDNVEVLNNLGIAFNDQGHHEQAEQCYRNALQINPNIPEIYSNLGNTLRGQGNPAGAIGCYRRALEMNPNVADVHHLLGIALQQAGQIEDAVASYQQAVGIRPDFAQAWGDLGSAFKDLGRLELAEQSCDRALEIDSNYAPAHMGRAIVRLLAGNFQKAWEDYEWRFKADKNNAHFAQIFNKSLWDGSSFKGKTLLIYSEQGLGDTLQFIRYLPLVKSLGGRVVVATFESMTGLLDGFPGIDKLMVMTAGLESTLDYDLSLPILSLPYVFKTTLATIPAEFPYIQVDPQEQAGWHQKMPGSGLKVGLVWKGNPSHSNDRNRSIALDRLQPLTHIMGIQFYSLQKGDVTPLEQELLQKMNCIDLGNSFSDFSDTAGALANLDVVISVDTSVVHLAGAMGRRVWTLLPFAPDWRWMLHRDDSPWYPGVRLFRQPQRGNWDAVVDRIAAELHLLVQTASGVVSQE